MFGKVYLLCCTIAFAKADYLGGSSISSTRQDVYLLCCTIAFAKADYLGGSSISSTRQDDFGNYAFNYGIVNHVGAANERWEAGDAYGNKRGAYSLTDIDGRTRRVEYVADSLGFRAGVKTNEPGTAASVHAAAVIDSPYDLPVAPTPISSATLVRPSLPAPAATAVRPPLAAPGPNAVRPHLPAPAATAVRPLPAAAGISGRPLDAPAVRPHLPAPAATAVRPLPAAAGISGRPLDAPAVRPHLPAPASSVRPFPTFPTVISGFPVVNTISTSSVPAAKKIRTAPLLADPRFGAYAPFVPTAGIYAYY